MTATETNSPPLENLDSVLSGLAQSWDELDQRGRQQAALLAFGRRSTAGPSISVLLQDACALVAEVLGGEMIGVAEIASGGSLAIRVATVGAEEPISESDVHKLPADPCGSLAAYALNTASPVVSAHLAAEGRFTDLVLRRLGVVGALAVPLRFDKQSYGALAVFTSQERRFTPDDVAFAETIAHLLTTSMARAKAEEPLRAQSRFTTAVLETVDALVVQLDAGGNLLDYNFACGRTTGFTVQEIRGKPFCNVFSVPEEADTIQSIFRRAVNSKTSCDFRSQLLTKDGSRRQIQWTLCTLLDSVGFVRALLLCGGDKTELGEVRAELERVRAAAERSRRIGAADASPDAEPLPSKPAFEAVGTPPGSELRSSPRRRYQYRQAIAPVYGGRLPSERDFFEVECEDISAGGIAFLLDTEPDFENVVVALGKAPALTCFAGRVVRVADRSTPEKRRFLVGCQFTGRVHLPS